MRQLRRDMSEEDGQALSLVLVALFVGTMLTSLLLVRASAFLRAGARLEQGQKALSSAEAGVEWALWRVKANPELTTSETYTSIPLEPFPSEGVNGTSFPGAQIRLIPGTNVGITETNCPDWEQGGGPHCYPLTLAAPGTITVTVDSPGKHIWIYLLLASQPCEKPAEDPPLGGETPYVVTFPDTPAGNYKILVLTSPPASGSLTMLIEYPSASYQIRSQSGERIITAEVKATYQGITVTSWRVE